MNLKAGRIRLTLWKDAEPDIPIYKQAKVSTRGFDGFRARKDFLIDVAH